MATAGAGEEATIQRRLRITDVVEESLEILTPIGGYSRVPLVSLEEAVTPLVPILPDVQSHAYAAKLKCNKPADELTQDESASIMLYTVTWEPLNECLYAVLNDILRTKDRQQKLKPWYLYLRLFLNALFRLPLLSTVAYRGVKLDLKTRYIEGETIVWWGFSSCTTSMGVLQSDLFLGKTGIRTMFSLQCKSARDIRKHSFFPTEDEVLLMAATQFKIVSSLDQGDLHMIQLEETTPPFPLLQPVPIVGSLPIHSNPSDDLLTTSGKEKQKTHLTKSQIDTHEVAACTNNNIEINSVTDAMSAVKISDTTEKGPTIEDITKQLRDDLKLLYALDEFTMPRCFFILPAKECEVNSTKEVNNWLPIHCKLYFLCECSHEPTRMHVAPRGGYSIKNSKQFIRRYESYLKPTIKIAQILLSAGNLAIPQLENVSIANNNTVPLEMNTPDYRQDMEHRLKFIDTLMNQSDGKPTSWRGTDLREIQAYLELVDDEHSLGNLRRVVTDEGHVRWVCQEHYNEISFNDNMNSCINDFKVIGGKFDQKTKETVVIGVNVTERIINMICDALTKGFNIVKLNLQDCSFYEGYLETLFDTIINRSSIRCLNMTTVRVRNYVGMVKYTCKNMITEFKNQSLEVRFNDTHNGNTSILGLILLRNKIHRTLNISTCDFLGHESDLQRCFESNRTVTELIVQYFTNIAILNTILNLKTNVLHQLKLTQGLWISTILPPFWEMLKKNTAFVEIDLMDHIGFKEETFVIKLLDTIKESKPTKYLSLHIENIQPSNKKETYLIKSLTDYSFISRLCISESVVSRKFIDALYYASKVNDTLTYVNFYNSQVTDEDKAQLHSLYASGNLLQLGFYEQSRWHITVGESKPSRGKSTLEFHSCQ
ncbi:unnamed protein product [Rotaria magnacalcarata]|uniref:NAD(P)(+)--arginine ADP-ribosyltransferase n=1 Tax=Rotaria magnacalcarata TaxID=392030 RepID=A0A819YF56_9BILA|nr:unnamed protein product [Rotaria magnacalcarata]